VPNRCAILPDVDVIKLMHNVCASRYQDILVMTEFPKWNILRNRSIAQEAHMVLFESLEITFSKELH